MASIGIVGLGAMGSAMAIRLIEAQHKVFGHDLRPQVCAELEKNGGSPCKSVGEVAGNVDFFIFSLPSAAAYHDVAAQVAAAGRRGLIAICTCTLHIADKVKARDVLAKSGITLLDTPVSGTRSSILGNTLALYGSGDEAAFQKVEPIARQFAKTVDYMGEFGNASKLKYILNHLVCVHNAATAEAMTLAKKGGLDIAKVQRLVADTYASSGVWRGRGKMMVDRDYVSSRGTYGIARKDAQIISDFAVESIAPVPMFQAALQMHRAGLAQGYVQNDTASLFEVYLRMAGDPDALPPQKPVI
jgi:putative dehydrogenase